MDNSKIPQTDILLKLISTKMPFGKYKGFILRELPENYLLWMHQKGYPDGKLGVLLETLYEIKLNGLEFLLDDFKKLYHK